jgi:hypothetical protein
MATAVSDFFIPVARKRSSDLKANPNCPAPYKDDLRNIPALVVRKSTVAVLGLATGQGHRQPQQMFI